MTNKTGDKKPCSRPQKLEMIRYSCLTRFVVSPGISKSLWYHTFQAEADDRLALDLKVCLGIGAIASTSSYIVTLVSGDRGRWGGFVRWDIGWRLDTDNESPLPRRERGTDAR